MKKIIGIICALSLISQPALAVPTLPSLSFGDLENISKEFSSNFTYTSVTPPSSFGKKFLPWLGFEIGAVAGMTKSSSLQTLTGSSQFQYLPHFGILTALSFDYGIAVESVLVPKTTIQGVSTSYTGLAAKWTITDAFFEWLPVSIAVKGHWAKAALDYGQNISNSTTLNQTVNAKIHLENTVWGLNGAVGYKILEEIEPYAGVGFLFGNAEASVSGTSGTLFTGSGFNGVQQTASSKPNSVQLFGGVQFHLLAINISAEAMRAFATNNYSAKFSFAF